METKTTRFVVSYAWKMHPTARKWRSTQTGFDTEAEAREFIARRREQGLFSLHSLARHDITTLKVGLTGGD